jgi:hypothetical protein
MSGLSEGQTVHQLIPFSSINCFAMFDPCCLKKDPSTSSRQVYSELKAAGAQFSLSTTKRAIEAVGFTASKPSYGPLVREVNKVKRVEFCQMLINTNETFDVIDVIYAHITLFCCHLLYPELLNTL